MAGTIVAHHCVVREHGYVYYVTADGSVGASRMKWAGRPGKHIVARHCVHRRHGYMYFVDAHGNVRETKMKRRGRR